MPVLKTDYKEKINELSKALTALNFTKKINGHLTSEEANQLEEINEALEGYKVLATLFGGSVKDTLSPIKKVVPTKIVKKTRAITEWPQEYSATDSPLQKIYALIFMLGGATQADLRREWNQREIDDRTVAQRRKLIENKTRVLQEKKKIIAIGEKGGIKRYEILDK